MRPTGRLALAAAGMTMIVALLVLSRVGARPAGTLADFGTAEATERPETPLAEEASIDQSKPPARELVESAPQAAMHSELAHPLEFELTCMALDSHGLPVQGAQFVFAPLGCSLNPWPATTGPDGTTVLAWRGKQPSMQMVVGIRAAEPQQDRSVDALQLVQAHAATKQHVAFLAARPLPGKQPAEHGAVAQLVQVAAAQYNTTNSCEFASQRQDCTTCHAKPGSLVAARKLRVPPSGLHPDSSFVDRLLTRPAPERVGPGAATADRFLAASLAQHLVGRENDVAKLLLAQSWIQSNTRIEAATTTRTVLARAALSSEGTLLAGTRLAFLRQASLEMEARMVGGSFTLVVRQPPAPPTTGRIAGRVFGSDGEPVAGAAVAMTRGDVPPEQSTTTDASGAYAFEHVLPGSLQLRAGGRDEGLAIRPVQVAAAATTPADLTLNRGASITGRAVGPDGTPLRGWRVEFVATHDPWIDACETREDARFVLPNLPGPGRLLLFAPDGPRLPVAVEPYVIPGAGDVCFDLRAVGEAKGALRVGLRCPVGLVEPEARVWHLESGRGISIPRAEGGAFLLQGLAAGTYRVEVGADGLGWRDLGTHWGDGKNPTDLGVVDLPQPCHVSLVSADGSRVPRSTKVELYRRRSDCDVRADGLQLDPAGALLLAPGDWLLLWPEPGGQIGLRTITCRAGDSVGVPLTRDAPREPAANWAK